MSSVSRETLFRVHVARDVEGQMQRQSFDIVAGSADAARKKITGQEAFKGAIILKTKRVKQ